ncbi:MAG: glycerol-3-phosphate acyltransferase [Chloroflexota bacterium]
MNISLLVLVAVAGYLIGSISFARIVGNIVAPEEDLSHTSIAIAGSDLKFESNTVSATAISARRGPAFGLSVALLDMLKAAAPVWFLQLRFPDQPLVFLLLAIMVVVGHNYPIYHRFHGGRGLSPIMGAYFMLDWISILITMIISSVLGFAVVKKYFLGYAGWLYLMIPAFFFRFEQPIYGIYAAAIAIIFTIASVSEFDQFRKLESADIDPMNTDFEGFENWNIQKMIDRLRGK